MNHDAPHTPAPAATIDFQNVSLRFPKATSTWLKSRVMQRLSPARWTGLLSEPGPQMVLQDLNLQIRPGDRVGLIGKNGAGKSTLLRLISRIYQPTQGTVTVNGRVAPLIEIGAAFCPDLTGRENTFLNAAIMGIKKQEVQARLQTIMEFAELGSYFEVPVKTYSTGMVLRLALAVATEVTPDILLLDETFQALDPHFHKKAQTRLDQLTRASAVTVLVSHDPSDIKRYCNRVLWLEAGSIKMDGRPEDVMPLYLEGLSSPTCEA